MGAERCVVVAVGHLRGCCGYSLQQVVELEWDDARWWGRTYWMGTAVAAVARSAVAIAALTLLLSLRRHTLW